MILESVKHGPLIWPMIEENGVTKTKKYIELSATEKIQVDCDLKAANIILQGLHADIHSLVNHHRVAKDLWERVQLLMQGTSLTKQDIECKLYDAFDNLPPEWSKFVTDVKLVKDLHTSNFDQLHAYIEQHELHANEVRIMRELNQDPLAFVVNQQMKPPHFNTYQSYQSSYNNPQLQQQFSPSQHGSFQPNQHYLSHYPSQTQFNHSSTPPSHTVTIQPLSGQPLIVILIAWAKSRVQDILGRQNSYAAGTSGTRANTSGTKGNYSSQQRVIECFNYQEEGHMARQCPKPKRKRDATWFRDKVLLVEAQGNGKFLNEEELEFLADLGVVDAKPVLMANLSSYGLDVLSEVPHSDTTHNDMLNQSVQEMLYSEQIHLVNYPENEITIVQYTNSSTQQDAMILFVFEQLSHQATNCFKVNKDNLIANETLSAELERYKERENEAKNIDNEIALEKKVKELDNIVHKMGQSAQTVHMLTKPQVFYDNNLKQAHGFQNPFYLKKAQQIRPMLYDGSVIAKETNVISIADSEETLMLEEESRSKMSLKQSDPVVLENKVNITPTNYAEFNRLSEDFGKRFVPQQELSDEQAFRLQTSHPKTDQSTSSPVKIEAPRELPKDRLLDQIISQDIVNIVVNSLLDKNTFVNVNSFVAMNDSVNYVEMCNKCLELKAELIKQHNMVEKDKYNRLLKSFFKLEQHCISLELAMKLNKEIFQKNNTSVNQTEPSFDQLFELNNLKAELQAKDTTIKKLKVHIKRVNETSTSESVKKDFDEIETINIELEHRVTKLIVENEHLKQTYKQLYDSIKPSRVRAKEQTESLVNQVNQKKLKGKDIVDNAATIAPGMYKLDQVILAPKVKNNREAHEYYLKHTMEQAAILRKVVEQAKSRNPLDSAPYSACMYVMLIQELLVNPSTNASGSKPSGNTKNDRISRTPSSNEKNKVEVQSRKVKSSLNKRNSDFKNVCNEHVKNPVKGAKAICSICNEFLFDANHAMYLIDHVNSMNMRAKSASNKNKRRKEWKPTRKVFNSVRYKWKPTKRTFTLVGNVCPLTRITPTNKVPLRVPIPLEVVAPEHVVTRVYTRRPKVVQIVLCENLGKLQAKADIGIFIGYAPKKKAYRIYNRRTQKIIETIHVDFDELTAMASEQSSLEPALHEMTPATPSSGLVPNPPPSAPFVPPSRHEWDLVFQPVFDEFFSPPASVASPVPVEEAPAPVESTGSPSSTTVDQDAPSPKTVSEESSSSDVISTTVHSDAPISEHLSKWTKDHPLQNIIGDPSRPVSTRLQLHEQALFCYYDAFLTSVSLIIGMPHPHRNVTMFYRHAHLIHNKDQTLSIDLRIENSSKSVIISFATMSKQKFLHRKTTSPASCHTLPWLKHEA
ncbi:retrovirus-related pol polyprotein from transposon TNT 1-94 [Tanacetum coccineum]